MQIVALAPRWFFWAKLGAAVIFWAVSCPMYFLLFCTDASPYRELAGTAESIWILLAGTFGLVIGLALLFWAVAAAFVRLFRLDATRNFDDAMKVRHAALDRQLDPDRYRDFPDGIVR